VEKIRTVKIDGNLTLGSTIIVTAILDYVPAVGDEITVTIEDASDTVKVDDLAMTKVTDNVYEYLYTTAITDDDGNWMATVKATSGSNTIYGYQPFEMAENPLEY